MQWNRCVCLWNDCYDSECVQILTLTLCLARWPWDPNAEAAQDQGSKGGSIYLQGKCFSLIWEQKYSFNSCFLNWIQIWNYTMFKSLDIYSFPCIDDYWLKVFRNGWLIQKNILKVAASVRNYMDGSMSLSREFPSLKENFVIFAQKLYERTSRKIWSLSHRCPLFSLGPWTQGHFPLWFSEERKIMKNLVPIEYRKLRLSNFFLSSSHWWMRQ